MGVAGGRGGLGGGGGGGGRTVGACTTPTTHISTHEYVPPNPSRWGWCGRRGAPNHEYDHAPSPRRAGVVIIVCPCASDTPRQRKTKPHRPGSGTPKAKTSRKITNCNTRLTQNSQIPKLKKENGVGKENDKSTTVHMQNKTRRQTTHGNRGGLLTGRVGGRWGVGGGGDGGGGGGGRTDRGGEEGGVARPRGGRGAQTPGAPHNERKIEAGGKEVSGGRSKTHTQTTNQI